MLLMYLSVIDSEDNEDYFIKLYNTYKQRMYTIAKGITNDHHLAENALQNAFIGIAKNLELIKDLDKRALEMYLFKAVKNSAISEMRKEAPSRKNVNIEEQYNELSSEQNIAKEVTDSELLREIIAFIKNMKGEYRDILTLRLIYELSFSRIAVALNLPVSTVKDRFYKGQKMIIEKFGGRRYE